MCSSLSGFGSLFFHPRSLVAFSSLAAASEAAKKAEEEQLEKQVVYAATSKTKRRVAAKVQDVSSLLGPLE